MSAQRINREVQQGEGFGYRYIEGPESRFPPSFGAHQLSGDQAGMWSLTVTKGGAITDMDIEDYH